MEKLKHKSYYGNAMIFIGIIVLLPIITIPFYNENEYLLPFLIPSIFSILLGIILTFIDKSSNQELENRKNLAKKSSVRVVFTWTWGVLIGAAPFVLAGILNPLQAAFESISGFTTTGLSVLDVSETSHIMLFHRSFMQYCGGLGFIMMMATFITNRQSMVLYQAEGHTDRLFPNLKGTVRIIVMIYTLFLVLGVVLYVIFGMPFFDAINHAMCALSTGGFSTKLNSIGDYHSFSINIITIFLMIIGTTNFAVLVFLVRGKWKKFFNVSEMKFLFSLILIFVPIVGISLALKNGLPIFTAMQESLFNVSSAISTTGYATMDFATWPQFSIGIIILLMIIGGGAGSTAGGLKLTRAYLLYRIFLDHLKNQFSSNRKVSTMKYVNSKGQTKIDDSLIKSTVGFFLAYITIFVVGSLLITLTENAGLTESMFEFSSALGTVGLSIGLTSSNTNSLTLIVEMFGMILGRLEIFTIIVAVSSARVLRK